MIIFSRVSAGENWCFFSRVSAKTIFLGVFLVFFLCFCGVFLFFWVFFFFFFFCFRAFFFFLVFFFFFFCALARLFFWGLFFAMSQANPGISPLALSALDFKRSEKARFKKRQKSDNRRCALHGRGREVARNCIKNRA